MKEDGAAPAITDLIAGRFLEQLRATRSNWAAVRLKKKTRPEGVSGRATSIGAGDRGVGSANQATRR